MNSRDRLGGGDLRKALEEQLEDIIHRHHGLRELRERRKSQEIAERLDDSKPLEEVLESILKSSPSLAALFLAGNRLSRPYKQRRAGEQNGREATFKGELHPTFFRFKKMKYGEFLRRDCEVGRRCRIAFETDVVNDYFKRTTNPGRFMVDVLEGDWEEDDIDWSLTLHDGTANASITIPEDAVSGDTITLQFSIEDDVLTNPFVNVAKLCLRPKLERPGGNGKKKKKAGRGNGDQPQQSGIQLPNIHRIHEDNWNSDFDRFSALKIIQGENEEDENQDVYDFYVNVDNLYLRTDMKQSKEEPRLIEDKFVYGNALIGLALIRDCLEREKQAKSGNNDTGERNVAGTWGEEFTVEEYVQRTTKALAPFILPLINNLGSLSEEDISDDGQIGDDE